MNKAKLNYFVDIGMGLSFIIASATGIFKWPGILAKVGIDQMKMPLRLFSDVHDWSGLIMVLFVLAHLILHMKWIIAMTKSLGKKGSLAPLFGLLIVALLFTAGCSGNAETETQPEQINEPAQTAAQPLPCPKGIVDDPYPGLCGSYTDSDGNGVCDFGQSG